MKKGYILLKPETYPGSYAAVIKEGENGTYTVCYKQHFETNKLVDYRGFGRERQVPMPNFNMAIAFCFMFEFQKYGEIAMPPNIEVDTMSEAINFAEENAETMYQEFMSRK